MRVEPRLAAFACAAVCIWSCNALWGVDDLRFDGATTATAGGGTTSSTTSGGSGGVTTSSGGTGGAGGQELVCLKACNDLFDCGLEDANCPGFAEDQRSLYLDGCEPGTGCLGQCENMPALLALIDPTDCAATVQIVAGASADFQAACENGVAGCGGAGGASVGGAGP